MTGRTVYIRAEDIVIDSDEDGYSLLVTDEDSGNSIRINIQAIVLDFYDNVRHTIGPYAAEANEARETASRIEAYLAMPRRIDTPVDDVYDAIDAGYDLDDPKSPGYRERMTETVDMREPDGVRYLGGGNYGATSR